MKAGQLALGVLGSQLVAFGVGRGKNNLADWSSRLCNDNLANHQISMQKFKVFQSIGRRTFVCGPSAWAGPVYQFPPQVVGLGERAPGAREPKSLT